MVIAIALIVLGVGMLLVIISLSVMDIDLRKNPKKDIQADIMDSLNKTESALKEKTDNNERHYFKL